MESEDILRKFGNSDYSANEKTYVMGINHLLGRHIAERFVGCSKILEVCTGAGFMLIPLSRVVNNIITIDINPEHTQHARNNLKISKVSSNVKFIVGDVMDEKTLSSISGIDAAFLDPDWSACDNKRVHEVKLSSMQPPAGKLLEKIFKMTQNIALRLPRELDTNELNGLPKHEFESICLDDKLKFYCIYFGKLVKKTGNTEFRAYRK